MGAFVAKAVVVKDSCVNGSESIHATGTPFEKMFHLRQARRTLTRCCGTELLITSVRPRLEFTGAYPPFIMAMIKTCHPALDAQNMDKNR